MVTNMVTMHAEDLQAIRQQLIRRIQALEAKTALDEDQEFLLETYRADLAKLTQADRPAEDD